jgi:hypothetical protein
MTQNNAVPAKGSDRKNPVENKKNKKERVPFGKQIRAQ